MKPQYQYRPTDHLGKLLCLSLLPSITFTLNRSIDFKSVHYNIKYELLLYFPYKIEKFFEKKNSFGEVPHQIHLQNYYYFHLH